MKECFRSYGYSAACPDCQKANEVEEVGDMTETTANPKEIVIDGATYRLVEPEKPEFEVGDFVKVNAGKATGYYGKIVAIRSSGMRSVEFAKPGPFHAVDGVTKYGHGFYVDTWEMEKVA